MIIKDWVCKNCGCIVAVQTIMPEIEIFNSDAISYSRVDTASEMWEKIKIEFRNPKHEIVECICKDCQ